MKLMNSLFAVPVLLCLLISCKNNTAKVSDQVMSVNKVKEDEKSPEPPPSPKQEKAKDQLLANADYLSDANMGKNRDTTGQFQLPPKQRPAKENPQSKPDWDKKIIKTASLNVEVKDYAIYNSSLREKIKQSGGYIAQEEQNQSDYKMENIVTIKIPVDQFDIAVTLITTGIEKLSEKKITSEDVTTEVVDTRSRLEAKKQVRLRYLDLLKQAKNMDEILSVQGEVNSIQEEIESAAGRINYLSHSASFSTINLTFFQVLDVAAKEIHEPSFLTRIANSFKSGWTWMGELITGLVSIWPLILLSLIAFIFFKKYFRSKAKPV